MPKKDISFDRKCIFVRTWKGKKDRYILLAEKAAEYLKSYLAMRNKYWLFEGESARQYGETSIQKCLRMQRKRLWLILK
jgi:site-specific recombinase XerD